MAAGWHLVAYDIRNDARLRRVARVLEGYGERIQYSVFRCRLTARGRARLLWELRQEMDEAEDSLLVIPVCNKCSSGILQRGRRQNWVQDPPRHVIV